LPCCIDGVILPKLPLLVVSSLLEESSTIVTSCGPKPEGTGLCCATFSLEGVPLEEVATSVAARPGW